MRVAVFVSVVALTCVASMNAVAQSAAQLTANRVFSPVTAGTTNELLFGATTLEVTVTFRDENTDPAGSLLITSFGFEEAALPPGWTYAGVSELSSARPSGGDFAVGWFWVFPPALPFSFTYRLNVDVPLLEPFDFNGTVTVSDFGPVNYFPAEIQSILPAVDGGETGISSADQNGDGMIDLVELLRWIQFFNVGAFHCEAGSEDGYAPGTGDTNCAPHTSDYDPQDWAIQLTEVLRLIQFFNMLGYYSCTDGEDGFCPGIP